MSSLVYTIKKCDFNNKHHRPLIRYKIILQVLPFVEILVLLIVVVDQPIMDIVDPFLAVPIVKIALFVNSVDALVT